MIPFRQNANSMENGFTLVEIIISLVVCGIVAAMIATYVENSMSRSFTPAEHLRDTLNIYSVAERMRFEKQNNLALKLNTLKTNIGTSAANPHNNAFGSYNVIYNDYVKCDAATTTTFTSNSGCVPATDDCILLITISDPDQNGIQVSTIFTE